MKSILSKAFKALLEALPMCWECLQCIIMKKSRARGRDSKSDYDTDSQ